MNMAGALATGRLSEHHARRQPAHLSVSLRHSASSTTTPTSSRSLKGQQVPAPGARSRKALAVAPFKRNMGSNGCEAQSWFNRENMNPSNTFSHTLQDEPPYHISQGSSDGSTEFVHPTHELNSHRKYALHSGMMRSTTNASSSNGYRSVIDDLTVANKKLKEENKRLKRSRDSHLAKDRMFEVHIHNLSDQNRRLLEQKLRDFTESVNNSSYGEDVKASSTSLDLKSRPRQSITSSYSNSQPVDSAYSSMTSLVPNTHDVTTDVSRQGKEDNIQDYLQNIPKGHLPKVFADMTDRQKKKLVVQRLEQLFTGKISMQKELHSHAQQQEEVSQSARMVNENIGIREANMLLNPMEVDSRPGNLDRCQSSHDQNSADSSVSPDNSSDKSGQRPTGPIDLDPDRAQIAGDNVEYLRHLGLSTPQLINEDSSDAEPDAQGWIYLNLLINMAQLHIVNVTPDFVRDAVQNVSEKFQISKDGAKLRWRGGLVGTQISSESESRSRPSQSPDDSDSAFETGSKRRKVDSNRFATIPTKIQDSWPSKEASGIVSTQIHYRPLFNHQNSSSDGSGTSSKGSSMSSCPAEEYGTGRWRNQRSWSATSRTGSQSKKRREDGTMVFYSNAQFCTDLSGDQDIPLPIHVTGVGDDGFSNHTRNALGCVPDQTAPRLSRTPSGSSLTFRPFKREVSTEATEQDLDTENLLVHNTEDHNMDVDSNDRSGIITTPQPFEASGLGGVRPEDHFTVQVKTRRARTSMNPLSTANDRVKKLHHPISLESFPSFSVFNFEDSITEKLSSMRALNSPGSKSNSPANLPVNIEYLSRTFTMLKPSTLPQAIGYYGASTDSETSVGSVELSREDSVESRNLQRGFADPKTMNWTKEVYGKMQLLEDEKIARLAEASKVARTEEDDGEESEDEENEDDDDDDDESIDMLAHMRAANPEEVARREAEFDEATKSLSAHEPKSAVANVAESDDSGSDDFY